MDFLNLTLKESTRVFMCEFVMVVFSYSPTGNMWMPAVKSFTYLHRNTQIALKMYVKQTTFPLVFHVCLGFLILFYKKKRKMSDIIIPSNPQAWLTCDVITE